MVTFLVFVLLLCVAGLLVPQKGAIVVTGVRISLSGVIGALFHGGYVLPTRATCLWTVVLAAFWAWLENGPYPGFCFRPVEVAFIDPDQQPPYTGSAWARERWFGRWREISVLCDERLNRSTRVRIIGIRFGWGVGIRYKVCRL